MQILSFFLVGMYYASVKVFYSSFFSQLTGKPGYKEEHQFIYNFFNGEGLLAFPTVFTYLYIGMLVMIVLISLATPIEKAMLYFYVIMTIFSFLTIASIVGIASFLIGTGFFPKP
jgi:hypothetical protein